MAKKPLVSRVLHDREGLKRRMNLIQNALNRYGLVQCFKYPSYCRNMSRKFFNGLWSQNLPSKTTKWEKCWGWNRLILASLLPKSRKCYISFNKKSLRRRVIMKLLVFDRSDYKQQVLYVSCCRTTRRTSGKWQKSCFAEFPKSFFGKQS